MYIYFDTNGTIKEIVNDKSIRNGSNEANKIYCYLEGEPEIDDIWYLQKLPSGELSNEVSFKNSTITKAIPYDAKRDMKYFKDFEQYKFYVFTLNTFLTSQKGLNIATIRVSVDNTMWALGELTFNVQENVINVDNGITQSQYDYLLLAYASRTLNEQVGRNLNDLIDDKIEAKLGDLASGSPKVFDTEANIEAMHDDEGIAVATDTGDIWVWNDTQEEYVNTNYKYIADVSLFYTKTESDNRYAPKSTAITHTGNQLQDYGGNNVYPNLNDGQVTPDKTTFFEQQISLYGKTYTGTPTYNINNTFFGFSTRITAPSILKKVVAYLKSNSAQTITCEIWSSYFNNVKNVIATTTANINEAGVFLNVEFSFNNLDLSNYQYVWVAIFSTSSIGISWANLAGITGDIYLTPTSSTPNAYLTTVWNNWNTNDNFNLAITIYDTKPKLKETYIPNYCKMNYLYVSTTGDDDNGDGSIENPYATIFKANSVITDNSKNNRYTIIVGAGTYDDLKERYSGSITSGANYVGIICKDYVYYESEDILHPENYVLTWDGYYGCSGTITTDDIIRKAIFHIVSGDMSDGIGGMHTHIKGFTITGKNLRYAFHVELEGRGYNTEWEISNCILNWYGRPDCSNDSGITPVIGLGGGYFEKGKISNCTLNNLQNGNTYGVQEHDNVWSGLYSFTPQVKKGIEITIENCNFNGTNINFRSYVADANLTNCSKNILIVKQCIAVSKLFFETIVSATTIMWRDIVYSSDITIDDTASYKAIS